MFNREFSPFLQKLLFHYTTLNLRTILPFSYFSVEILVFRNFHEILEFLPVIFIICYYSKIFFIFFFFDEDDNFSGNNNFGSVESLPENSVLFDDDLDLEINFDQHHQNTNHDDHSLSQRNFLFHKFSLSPFTAAGPI